MTVGTSKHDGKHIVVLELRLHLIVYSKYQVCIASLSHLDLNANVNANASCLITFKSFNLAPIFHFSVKVPHWF